MTDEERLLHQHEALARALRQIDTAMKLMRFAMAELDVAIADGETLSRQIAEAAIARAAPR